MRRITFVNARNVSLDLYFDPYLITRLDGIETPSVDLQTQKAPLQDGVSLLDQLFQPRVITVEGVVANVRSLSGIWSNRSAINAALNPKLGPGQITFQDDNETLVISALPMSCLLPNKDAQEPFQKFQFQFFCPDPYWRANADSSISFVLVTGGFTFPMTFPFVFGAYTGLTPTYAVNTGDSPTPVLISIYGPSANPIVKNLLTGEYVSLNITIGVGDRLDIDTSFGNRTILLYPSGGGIVNQSGSLKAGSTFWQLQIGSNQITFVDDGLSTQERCVVTWRNRFSGK